LTTFLRQAGYHELSIALWQAALEYTVLRPEGIEDSQALSSFEQYWDSEAPRLGEQSSKGWRTYLSSELKPSNEPLEYAPEQISPGENVFDRFVTAENKTEQSLFLPGRTIDEFEEDVFHIIFFSDISPFLESLFHGPDIAEPLTWAFLCYVGLPPLEVKNSTDRYVDWWLDPFLRDEGVNLWTSAQIANLPTAWKYSRSNTATLFGDVFPEKLFVDTNWLHRALGDLVMMQDKWEQLAEYYIAFYWSCINKE
jgi:hypothetical protein